LKKNLNDILIVDDDPAIRDMMIDILELEGFTGHIARNGQEALHYLRHKKVEEDDKGCLIFLDLMMPVMDGRVLCQQLTKEPELRDPHVIVIMSALDQLAQASNLHIDEIMPKPFTIDDMLAIINKHFA
jgi:CheY-like chemotaxis protein